MLAIKLILFAIVAVCVQGDLTQEDRDFLKKVFENIPVEDRKEFLIHQLHRGYILKHPSEEYPVNETVTLKLYEIYTGKSMETTRYKLLAMICFDDGSCVDTDEPAVAPLMSDGATHRLYEIYSGDEMRSARVLLQEKICFDDGTCIDTGDSGIYP